MAAFISPSEKNVSFRSGSRMRDWAVFTADSAAALCLGLFVCAGRIARP